MQFVTIVILPVECRDIVAGVTHLMAPYDMELSVPPWKQYVPQDELDYLLKVYEPYGLRRDDIDAVVAALHEDTGFTCGHDGSGYWWMFTANPQGKWDGWRLMNPQDDPWPAAEPLPEHLYP